MFVSVVVVIFQHQIQPLLNVADVNTKMLMMKRNPHGLNAIHVAAYTSKLL